MADVWVRRLAELPGFDDVAPRGVKRSTLPGHDATPQVRTFSYPGETPRQFVMWPTLDSEGTTSASPASQYHAQYARDAPTSSADTVRRLNEALELPGDPTDYHFIIQAAIEQLSSPRFRFADPSLVATVERFCRLDIRLIEAFPEIIRHERDGQPFFAAVRAFGWLANRYEREGCLHEALAVLERELQFGGLTTQVEKLRERIAILDAEDNG